MSHPSPLSSSFLTAFSAVVFGLLVVLSPSVSFADNEPEPDAQTHNLSRQEVIGIVRDLLQKEPELIQEALNSLKDRQALEAQNDRIKVIRDNKTRLFDRAGDPYLGNPNGKIELIEFFDYNCGYCRKGLDTKLRLLEEYPDLKIILKEFPILSEDSLVAAELSLSFKDQPQVYKSFHTKLMAGSGKAGRGAFEKLSQELGVSLPDEKTVRANQDIRDRLTENYALANALKISGTPAYVIGEHVYYGLPTYEQLKLTVDNMIKCGGALCR